MKLTEQSVCYAGNDVSAAYENVYYLSSQKPDLIKVRVSEIRDDIYDMCCISYSEDDGRTWSEDQPYPVSYITPAGMVRKRYGLPVVDGNTDRLVVIDTTSVLPTDNVMEYFNSSFPMYRVSLDKGKTWLFDDPIILHGIDYSTEHPLPFVWTGKNAVQIINMPFFDSAGRLIVPIQITRLNEDGSVFCPQGALSFHETMVLIGTWCSENRMKWESSEKVTVEPDISTRGLIEGAVSEMPDGRFLLVMRGSNAGNYTLPGHKWYCVSYDGCKSWSEVRPWGFTDGTLFYSPSSFSTILPHSNGQFYWIGNICDSNPKGNGPDYPLYIGKIDSDTCLLCRESLFEIDTTKKEDPVPVHLRNFTIYEERSTGDMIMRMCRLWVDEKHHMRGDTYLYRLKP